MEVRRNFLPNRTHTSRWCDTGKVYGTVLIVWLLAVMVVIVVPTAAAVPVVIVI